MSQNNLPAILAASGKQQIARILGDEKKGDQFARIAMGTIRNSKQLQRCSPESLMSVLLQCASFDMEPDARGLVWIVPYKGEATFQLGYKGCIELAVRSGQVKNIFSQVVYRAEIENDMFQFIDGTDRKLVHNRDFLRPELREGEIVAAYAVAEMKNGSRHVEVIDKAHIDKRKAVSASLNGKYPNLSPWKKWEMEMVKKTAVKALCKNLPQSVEKLHMALAAESEEEKRIIVKDAEDRKVFDTQEVNNKINALEQGEPNGQPHTDVQEPVSTT